MLYGCYIDCLSATSIATRFTDLELVSTLIYTTHILVPAIFTSTMCVKDVTISVTVHILLIA